MQSFGFHALGLHFQADSVLPGLIASRPVERPDIRIYLREIPPEAYQELQHYQKTPPSSFERDGHSESHRQFWTDAKQKYFYLSYNDGPSFIINRKGSKIWIVWPPALSKAELVLYLITALGLTLRLRGLLCLHASAIVVNGAAVAIIGASGAGKSTTAAAFVKMGYPLLTDDILSVDGKRAPLFVWPGFPRLRLWPDAASFLYGKTDSLPYLLPDWDKHYLDLNADKDEFHGNALPLGAIYLLEGRIPQPTPQVEPLAGAESMVSLLANTYQNELLSGEFRAKEFRSLETIIKHIPVRRVYPSQDLKDLPLLCQTILTDYTSLTTDR